MRQNIVSERLKISPFQVENIDEFYVLESHEKVLKYINVSPSRSKKESLSRLKGLIEKSNFHLYQIFTIKQNEFLGLVGLIFPENDTEDNSELLYRILPEF